VPAWQCRLAVPHLDTAEPGLLPIAAFERTMFLAVATLMARDPGFSQNV
jgi:hypothetical protein